MTVEIQSPNAEVEVRSSKDPHGLSFANFVRSSIFPFETETATKRLSSAVSIIRLYRMVEPNPVVSTNLDPMSTLDGHTSKLVAWTPRCMGLCA